MNICILAPSVVAAFALLLTTDTALSWDNPEVRQETVYLLCSGTACPRSMKVVATFTTVGATFEAVEKLRQLETGDATPHIGVFTGKADPMRFHPDLREELKPESCSVVLKTIRCGNWFIEGEPMDRKTVEEKVDEWRKSGRSAEVIYHFSGRMKE